MRQSFVKGFKNFFNSKPKNPPPVVNQQVGNKVITFGQQKGTQEDDVIYDESKDSRYQKLQQYPSLKDLGLKKDQIQAGEIAVLYQTKLVFCKLSQQQKYEDTRLIITNYKMCIRVVQQQQTFFPLSKIDKVQKYTTNQNVFKILIELKDGRKFKMRVTTENAWKKVYERIQKFAFVTSKTHFFAFRNYEYNKGFQENYKGWKLYDYLQEFKRMGVIPMPHTQDNITQYTSDFKILDNKDGKVCSTYPQMLIVPSRMAYDSLLRCAKFRSRERMPILTYAFEYQDNKYSCIFRSSQCRSGVQNNRSLDDQLMLKVISNMKYDPKLSNTSQLVNKCTIFDARNYLAALGNKFQGKGFESTEHYQSCDLQFLNIPNIHAVRQSYNKMLQASYGEDSKFFSLVTQSKWYEYIFIILSGAIDLAKNLTKGINNLVHCSDGWDRTSQLCALGALMLDPYYRTIKGFQILIQKDWIYFGHQFAKRIGQGMNNPGNEDKSQIFLQYLDCITQLMYQFPSQFEFNYSYIRQVGEQTYNHLYGNFLCNCYQEMRKYSVFSQTVSLWSKIKKDEQLYLNPFYAPSKTNLLDFDPSLKNMRFWKQHFVQHIPSFRDVYDIYSCKFTEDNLEIMHKHINKEKQLLEEKYNENDDIIQKLQSQLLVLTNKQENIVIQMNQKPLEKQEKVEQAKEAKEVSEDEEEQEKKENIDI